MDAEEIGRLIGELEIRVERLRALYEQYFMGIERLEPLTLRKDIDRRLWALRREQIRNTGLRFKLETTIQRYNTYQQYWQRIVREIEQGTYQRDLGRAAQRFGDNVVTAFARRRQKMYENAVIKKAERDARRTGPIASEAPPAETEDAPPSSNEAFDVTFEDSDAAPSTRSPEVPALPPIELLELDIGISTLPRPAPASAGVVPTMQRQVAPPAPTAPRAPFPAAARLAPTAPTPASPVNARPAVPAVSPVKPATPLAAIGKPTAPAATPAKAVAPPAPGTKPAAPPAPAAKPTAPAAPGAKPTAPLPSAAQPAAPPAAVARPAAPAAPFARPGAPAAPVAKPAFPAVHAPQGVAPPHRPAAPSRPDVPSPPVMSDESSLSPIRMRQIYGAFVEAKRRANESTASVTYEKIASNLESVAKELRAKHKARSVDFEVVMKNGKPVLKPVIKG